MEIIIKITFYHTEDLQMIKDGKTYYQASYIVDRMSKKIQCKQNMVMGYVRRRI